MKLNLIQSKYRHFYQQNAFQNVTCHKHLNLWNPTNHLTTTSVVYNDSSKYQPTTQFMPKLLICTRRPVIWIRRVNDWMSFCTINLWGAYGLFGAWIHFQHAISLQTLQQLLSFPLPWIEGVQLSTQNIWATNNKCIIRYWASLSYQQISLIYNWRE